MMQNWAEDLHRRIAAAIKNARGNRSAQWLADQTKRLGYPISRAALANYESGRKKTLDIAELLTLAAALRIPPVTLLFPQLPDGRIELLPDVKTSSWDAVAWFSGEAGSPNPDNDPWPTSKEYELIRAIRDRQDQLLATAQFVDYFQQALRATREERRNPRLDPEMRAITERLHTLKEEITRLDEVIRQNGGVTDHG